MLNITMVQDFYPLKTEIDRLPIGFRLNSVSLQTKQNDKARCIYGYICLPLHLFHHLIIFKQAQLS